MKIGIDASRYAYGQSTGVEWYSWHIINALIDKLSKEDKLTLYSRDFLDMEKMSGQNDGSQRVNQKSIQNKVIFQKRLWTLLGLSREMKKNPPDVLFVPSHTLPLNLPERSVITIHDVAFKYLRKSYSFFQYYYLNWSTKFAVKHATKIIVPSEATKKDLMNFYDCPEEKIVVIPHGFTPPELIHDNIFKDSVIFKYFGITKNLPYILFVGRLESKKNLSRLIAAFDQFSKNHPDYNLILAGKRGVGFHEILKTATQLNLMDKIIMPGYVTEHEKAALYKYCKIFAFPSLYEGFGLPILEAFYYKKPVLCSNVSSLPEVGGEAVRYVDPYESKSIMEGLEDLSSNDQYLQELIKKGEEKLKDFSWKISAEKTLKVLYGQ